MIVVQASFEVPTHGRGLIDVTSHVAQVLASSGVRVGTCTVFLRHTSASLVIQENASPDVPRDLERWIEWVAPERPAFGPWLHDDEGPDDMAAHARAALLKTSEVVPVQDGRLGLGTWQGLFLWEHRTRGHRRTISVTVMGIA